MLTQGRRSRANLGLEVAIPLGLKTDSGAHVKLEDVYVRHNLISSRRHRPTFCIALAPSENPNGIPAQSPGLRGTSYPGSASAKNSQPQRGCGHSVLNVRVILATTPLGLLRIHHVYPR